MKRLVISTVILALSLLPFDLHSSVDQTTTERIIKENKHFIDFIDVSMTNFAESKKEEFKKLYEKHFNADVAFLQSDYRRAFKRVYSCQEGLHKLFEDLLKNYYLEDSKTILDSIAPMIIRSKNARARLYLTLGYRDRTVSWNHYSIGEASNPKLYSYKIYHYEEAITIARRSKRYAFLALFECQKSAMKRKIYYQLLKGEKESGRPLYTRFLDLNEDDTIKMIGKNFEDYDKEQAGAPGKQEKEFEKSVEKRVRFRSEKRMAQHFLNEEFDRAEDIMRKYIDDFNFKLVQATFDALGKEETGDAASKIDFSKFRIHLVDNYLRLSKQSILDGIISEMKVDDSVDRQKIGKETDEAERKVVRPEKEKEKEIPAETGKKSETKEKKGADR